MSVSITTAVLVLGSGWLADRYHPVRVVVAGSLLGLLATPVNLIWLFWHPQADALWHFHLHLLQWGTVFEIRQVYLVQFCIALGLTAPIASLTAMWDPIMLMRIFPRERLGQFCSTNAVWRSLGGILGATLVGAALDIVGRWVGKDRAYFYIPVWHLAFGIPAVFFLILLYRSWKRHGGAKAYVAPGSEPAPLVQAVQSCPGALGLETVATPEITAQEPPP